MYRIHWVNVFRLSSWPAPSISLRLLHGHDFLSADKLSWRWVWRRWYMSRYCALGCYWFDSLICRDRGFSISKWLIAKCLQDIRGPGIKDNSLLYTDVWSACHMPRVGELGTNLYSHDVNVDGDMFCDSIIMRAKSTGDHGSKSADRKWHMECSTKSQVLFCRQNSL